MSQFTLLNDLPIFDLEKELDFLLNNKLIDWTIDSQICLNTVLGHEDDYTLGSGSLAYNWNNKVIENGIEKFVVQKIENPKQEEDFNILCTVFRNTLFEKVYNALSSKYKLGRVRLMKSNPKTCLSWHVDSSPRIHFPIKTQDSCFMVIEEEVKHLPEKTWWWTNTILPHTAFNASKEARIHLVATVLG